TSSRARRLARQATRASHRFHLTKMSAPRRHKNPPIRLLQPASGLRSSDGTRTSTAASVSKRKRASLRSKLPLKPSILTIPNQLLTTGTHWCFRPETRKAKGRISSSDRRDRRRNGCSIPANAARSFGPVHGHSRKRGRTARSAIVLPIVRQVAPGDQAQSVLG